MAKKKQQKSQNNFSTFFIESGITTEDTRVLELAKGKYFEFCSQYYKLPSDNGDFDDLFIRDNQDPEIRFYYLIHGFSGNPVKPHEAIIYSEEGIGYIKKEGRKTFFVRETPLRHGNGKQTASGFDPSQPLYRIEAPYLAITSAIPPSYAEALASPHSIIASHQPFRPTPVELEENSLLGRIDDRVQSIDKDELREILTDEAILDAVKTTKGPIALTCSRIRMNSDDSVVSTPIVRLYPHYKNDEQPKAQKGALIFNNETNTLQYYTGKEWRTIAWEKDK